VNEVQKQRRLVEEQQSRMPRSGSRLKALEASSAWRRAREASVAARLAGLMLGLGLAATPAFAQPLGTAFTYQGRLVDGGSPATGSYDFQLILFDAPVGGSQVDHRRARGRGGCRWPVHADAGLRAPGVRGKCALAGGGGGGWSVHRRVHAPGAAPAADAVAQRDLRVDRALDGRPGQALRVCDDTDNDLLAGLTCANGQVAKFNARRGSADRTRIAAATSLR